jgi:hypothetical protein
MNKRRTILAGMLLAPAAPLAARAFRAEAVTPAGACGQDGCGEDRLHSVSGGGSLEPEQLAPAPDGAVWRCPFCGRFSALPEAAAPR